MTFLASPRSSNVDVPHAHSQTHVFGSSRSPVRFIQRIINVDEKNIFTQHEKIVQEFQQQKEIDSPDSQPYLNTSFNQGKLLLQRPYVNGIPLSSVLFSNMNQISDSSFEIKENSEFILDLITILYILEKVIKEIAYLHDKDIVLKNLKLENIIITSNDEYSSENVTNNETQKWNGSVKIVDFGFDFLYEDTKQMSSAMQLLFGGPESLDSSARGSSFLTKELDIYHFGLLFYVLLGGKCPWSASTNLARITQQMITNTLPLPEKLSEDIELVVRQCLAHDPLNRPLASEVHQMILSLIESHENAPPSRSPQIQKMNSIVVSSSQLTTLASLVAMRENDSHSEKSLKNVRPIIVKPHMKSLSSLNSMLYGNATPPLTLKSNATPIGGNHLSKQIQQTQSRISSPTAINATESFKFLKTRLNTKNIAEAKSD